MSDFSVPGDSPSLHRIPYMYLTCCTLEAQNSERSPKSEKDHNNEQHKDNSTIRSDATFLGVHGYSLILHLHFFNHLQYANAHKLAV